MFLLSFCCPLSIHVHTIYAYKVAGFWQASAASLYSSFFFEHMSIATLLARAERAARVSRRLAERLHMVKATLEARSARVARVFTREHLFSSIFKATLPARRHSSRFILPLWLHCTHLLWMSTSVAWHFFSDSRSHFLLLP